MKNTLIKSSFLIVILFLLITCSKDEPIVEDTLQTVTICNQVWAKTNLNVSHYRNGEVIPQVTDPTDWINLTTGAWCYYKNSSANGAIYGKLYNWYAVVDPRGLAPIGWHVPTVEEWTTLITDCLGGKTVAGGKMKETGIIHWTSPNTNATNSSGFTGLPGGFRGSLDGSFYAIGKEAAWRSSSEFESIYAWHAGVAYDRETVSIGGNYKTVGFSVRCLKD